MSKITIELTKQEIIDAIDQYVRRNYPDLIKNNHMHITFSIGTNGIWTHDLDSAVVVIDSAKDLTEHGQGGDSELEFEPEQDTLLEDHPSDDPLSISTLR